MENSPQQPPPPPNVSENLKMPRHRDDRSPSCGSIRRREPLTRVTRRSRSLQRRSRFSRSRSRSFSPSPRLGSSRRRSVSRGSEQKRHRKVENPAKSRCLGVFGLNVNTAKDKIVEIFSKFGSIERVQVVIDAKTNRSRGYCFVYFDHTEDAKKAKDYCNGIEVDSRIIRVDYSITQRAHTPTPGIYKGQKSRYEHNHEHHSSSLRSHHRDDERDRDRDRGYAADEYYCRSSRRHSSRDRRSSSRHSRDRRHRHRRSYSRSYTPERRYR